EPRCRFRDVVHGGDLRDAHAGDDARRANRVVHDCVVGDEAVRRAVDLDVVNGDAQSKAPRAEWLDYLEVVEMALRVSCVQTRPVTLSAAAVVGADQTAG